MAAISDRFAVVGLGRLGACLVKAMHQAGVEVVGLADQVPESAQNLADELGLYEVVCDLAHVAEKADIVFLAVNHERCFRNIFIIYFFF